MTTPTDDYSKLFPYSRVFDAPDCPPTDQYLYNTQFSSVINLTKHLRKGGTKEALHEYVSSECTRAVDRPLKETLVNIAGDEKAICEYFTSSYPKISITEEELLTLIQKNLELQN